MSARELNLDGLVGPTHSYAGLSLGNVASTGSRSAPSDPRAAALEGLEKMRLLADLGVDQAVLPPHERPSIAALRALGFCGDEAAVLARASREAPGLLAACASASAMWTANAATVAPAADTSDGRVHLVPANLAAKLHRAIEPPGTGRLLQAVFPPGERFAHHPALLGGDALGDEGAANHTRLAPGHDRPGLHVLVYGREADEPPAGRFPARQTREASAAVSRLLALPPERVVLVRQSRTAIDAGVFHNDVIAVGNEGLLLWHEDAFADGAAAVEAIAEAYRAVTGAELSSHRIARGAVSLEDAVASYLFNSQLVTRPDGTVALIAPAECQRRAPVRAAIGVLVDCPDNPVVEARYVDLGQSMRNGGGPACLRLRVVLDEVERAAMAPGVRFDAALHERLAAWVQRHYRDRLEPSDLADPALLEESRGALDELTEILGLGSVYDFQA